ncbi:hypothetical protein [Plantactinospora sp. BC1]|uniref:hypothetical protein n=1 Tax=Plantactinospora sp. BC1 TaxID=2108470 RepID=UPI001F16D99C|nr:hypothetical protein [Plantactinospora sp. BC1]
MSAAGFTSRRFSSASTATTASVRGGFRPRSNAVRTGVVTGSPPNRVTSSGESFASV